MTKLWTCDFKDCSEIAQFYREYKGELMKLCTKHEVQSARQHLGKHIDYSDLDEDDIRYLQSKEEHSQYVKKVPFNVQMTSLENQTQLIEIHDRKNNIWRSFEVGYNSFDSEGFFKVFREVENGKFENKSIDDLLKILKDVSFKKS